MGSITSTLSTRSPSSKSPGSSTSCASSSPSHAPGTAQLAPQKVRYFPHIGPTPNRLPEDQQRGRWSWYGQANSQAFRAESSRNAGKPGTIEKSQDTLKKKGSGKTRTVDLNLTFAPEPGAALQIFFISCSKAPGQVKAMASASPGPRAIHARFQ